MEQALVLIRLVAFAAGTVMFGTPLFALYARAPDQAPGFRPMAIAAAALAVLCAAGALIVQTGTMAGDPKAGLDPATLKDVLASGSFGASILARLGAGALALVLTMVLPTGRRLWTALALLGTIALGGLAFSGHGAADEGTAGIIHLAADLLHLLAAGIWLGALAGFLALLLARPQPGATVVLHAALTGFSGIGSAAVAAIVASGLVNTWFLVGLSRIGALPATAWGVLLLAKLAIVAAMLGLAALNRFGLTPKLGATLKDDPAQALEALRRSVALETVAGLIVLALVVAMGVLAPPASL